MSKSGLNGPRPVVAAVVSTFGAMAGPIQSFFRLQAASGILLFAAALGALVWANSEAHASYAALFSAPIRLSAGGATLAFEVQALINEGLMSVFFFVVGMEIKRELVAGELSSLRKALLPAIAAVGGMVIPSALFLSFNATGPGRPGWGIPMATDIAFAIGCLTLLGKRVPQALSVFLMGLAIFDDIGGILVIAIFYGHGISAAWLLAAAGVTAILFVFNRANVRSGFAYAVLGGCLWYALHRGGIHATISGVVLGLMIPARSRHPARDVLRDLEIYTRNLLASPVDEVVEAGCIHNIEEKLEDLEAPLQRFIHTLHPWMGFAIMPLFALANSGIDLRDIAVADLASPVALGTAVGLALGKPIGIVGASALAIKLGLADRPGGASWFALLGVAVLAGIGFTVALFIATLAFPGSPALLTHAKIGIMLGSLFAGLLGTALLRAAKPPPPPVTDALA
jgi:NhaA family Na+:H+ antiporter